MEGCRLYRLAPHCSAAPAYLVLKAVLQPQLGSLDPRGVFAVHCPDHLYVWQVRCPASGSPSHCILQCGTSGDRLHHICLQIPTSCSSWTKQACTIAISIMGDLTKMPNLVPSTTQQRTFPYCNSCIGLAQQLTHVQFLLLPNCQPTANYVQAPHTSHVHKPNMQAIRAIPNIACCCSTCHWCILCM